MHKKIIILFLLLGYISNGFGQINFVEGYIITHDMDTIRGKIKDVNMVKRNQVCVFKNPITNETKPYSPNEIYGYRYTNSKSYISKPFNTKDSLISQTYFFEKLFDGIIKIYMLNNLGLEHFFVEKEAHFYALTNSQITLILNNIEVKRKKLEYIGILIFLLQDAPDLVETIQNTQLNANSLISLAIQYHEKLASEKVSYSVPYYKEKAKIKYSFTLGYKYNNYTFNYRDENTTRTLFVPSINSEFGVKADFEFPKMIAEPYLGLSYEKFSGTNSRIISRLNSAYYINPEVYYTLLSTNMGISFPLKSTFYPSKLYAGIKLIYILDFKVYNWNLHIDNKFSRLNLGFNAGYSHLFRISSKVGLTIGAEASFWGMKFGDAAKFIPALGVTMELNVL